MFVFKALCHQQLIGPRCIVQASRKFSRSSVRNIDITNLSTRKYWEEVYSDDSFTKRPFDWFINADDVMDKIELTLKTESYTGLKILDIGCGTSSLPTKLYSSSNQVELHCVDFVTNAVKQQKAWLTNVIKAHELSSSHFLVADACCLPYRDSLFDLIIDKGTMDALIKNQDTSVYRCSQMLKELGRLCKTNGTVVQISDEDPEFRLPYLEKLCKDQYKINWCASLLTSFGSIEYFLYNGSVDK